MKGCGVCPIVQSVFRSTAAGRIYGKLGGNYEVDFTFERTAMMNMAPISVMKKTPEAGRCKASRS